MSFQSIPVKDQYITEKNDIPNEFYNIVLPESILYKRAAGFFSSSALISISKGLKSFYYNGGKIQLIVSPILSEEDYEAIKKGYKAREDVIQEALIRDFDISAISNDDGCNFLAWLIYENRLEIKIVTKKDSGYGLFHDKFLILYDAEGNKISSRGSSNESRTAYEDNYETIEVDFSWNNSTPDRTAQRESQFDALWNGLSNQWVIDDFPEALRKNIIQIRKKTPEIEEYRKQLNTAEDSNDIDTEEKLISMPPSIKLRPYQIEAIKNWLNNYCVGIYEMATGTGKTITAISSMVKLLEQHYKLDALCGVVIVVPYKVLLEQWVEDLESFGFSPICCYDSTKSWRDKVNTAIDLFNNGYKKNFCLITTNKTFSENVFQKCLEKIKKDYIFCADEMHHLATDGALIKLPQNAKFKLGLSATLMTKYADDEMNRLKEYFGGVVYEFTMKEAIEDGFLTPYYYHPVFVDLTEDELDKYLEISRKISRICAANDGKISDDNPNITALLSQRTRLIASAENKIAKLKEFKDVIKDSNFTLFYCGDKIDVETNEKFINRVNTVLRDDIGISIQKFTSEETKQDREVILELFASGKIQGLSAIKCLDEGVDIPQLKRAFILSSGGNPKEFIQRRGRILRKAQGKEYAEIYDFIVLPTLDKNRLLYLSAEELKSVRKIILREYERLKEFADLAINGQEACRKLLNMWDLCSIGG